MNPGFRRPWIVLLVLSALVLLSMDVVLLGVLKSYFGAGFNGQYVDTPPLIGGFLLASLVLDLVLLLGIWLVAIPLLKALKRSPLQIFGLVALLGVLVPAVYNFVRLRIELILGDLVRLALLWDVAGRDQREIALKAFEQMPRSRILAVTIPVLALLSLWLLRAGLRWGRRLEQRTPHVATRFAPPRTRALLVAFLFCLAAGTAVLGFPRLWLYRIQWGLNQTASGQAIRALSDFVTDLDRDGFGFLARPRDPAPLDGSRNPYAVDIPGNGVDENGLGGDFPLDFSPHRPVPVEPVNGEARPDVLLVFLESFRGELVGARFDGREITPFLNRLGAEGATSTRAYVHTPFTIAARAQLLSGSLDPQPGSPNLIDDFRELGYEIGWFSGQDDSFGGSDELLGLERADVFYDARQDLARRTSRSSSPASLQVSADTVLEHTVAFLAERDTARPLFLYVNLVDTHYPYQHREVQRILDVEPVRRREIRPRNAERLWGTYANTAAYLDRALERLLEAWWEHRGADGVVLVTADHGQSFYEDGLLGHGEALNDLQTRVPLIVWGIGGDWPEPIGLADLRGLLLRHLGTSRSDGVPRARFRPDPSRSVVLYLSRIERPALIGLRSLDERLVYDFRIGRFRAWDNDGERIPLSDPERLRRVAEVVHNWELLRRDRAAAPPR